jgi:hypothetical protein
VGGVPDPAIYQDFYKSNLCPPGLHIFCNIDHPQAHAIKSPPVRYPPPSCAPHPQQYAPHRADIAIVAPPAQPTEGDPSLDGRTAGITPLVVRAAFIGRRSRHRPPEAAHSNQQASQGSKVSPRRHEEHEGAGILGASCGRPFAYRVRCIDSSSSSSCSSCLRVFVSSW